ncbi:adenylate/guanylate cyclase domain-containing protein [Natronoflexus pectinivorans]|uniref:Class 3 adenylate cyclase n=1 Tax=Natronoflexus pectinivorans TaxID=682526 RepID=A0A4R2G8R9_9BACT|nr:adenylate/guanylate cyclase domain-containing protein [Natronoflexus pectinivorans]TCO04062.1 class 3 adenylate cyclase [Natronoflexus pectinivorans]
MESPKILIADDVDYLVEFIKSHLDTMCNNATYYRARNGYEVFTIAMRKKPDLILLDWEMPEFSGMDALQTLNKHEETKDIPVIMVSGFTKSDHVRMALEAGAIDYLRKPIEPDELLARVRTAATLAKTMKELRLQKSELESEKVKTDNILKGLLPAQILESLKTSDVIAPKRFRNVTVIMADLVDFTPKSQKMSPKRLLDELKTIFTAFDKISSKFNCTRIKTIGDAYLAVSGMWNNDRNHALVAAKMAERMRQYIIEHNQKYKIDWEIRIGLNSGDIVAGIISEDNLSYDIFGDTVNTAARMQGYSNPMQINVSQSTYDLIKDYYTLIKRISRKVKGKGSLNMYYLHRPIVSKISRTNEFHPYQNTFF